AAYDAPPPPQPGLERPRLRRLEGPRGERYGPDALDLERPQAAPALIPADEVERVRLERRLDEVRVDDRPAGGGFRRVVGRLVLELHHAALGPGLGQAM